MSAEASVFPADPNPPAPAPLLGQHTVEVIAEVLGLSDQHIGDLSTWASSPKPTTWLLPRNDHGD